MKFSICSEIFKEWNDIERTIAYVKQVGYDGLEIAPFAMAESVTDIPKETRQTIVRAAKDNALDIVGLHWLLAGPQGLYINHPDVAVRDRTVDYLKELTRFCGEVGGKVMIFGSPKQRNIHPPLTYDQAFAFAVESFSQVMPLCADAGVTLCMEPLSSVETDFCQNAEETRTLVEAVDHPNFQMMLDVKAMTTEKEDRPVLIRRHADRLRHFHANDANLNGPGWGDVDFCPIFEALKEIEYTGYVSVEVFNFEPGPEAIATKSLAYMQQFV